MKYNASKIFNQILHPGRTEAVQIQSKSRTGSISTMEIFHLSELCRKRIVPNPALDGYIHKNYDPETILKVLNEIKEYDLTIIEASTYYKISKNTISKWLRAYKNVQ